MQLRDYQEQAVKAVFAEWANGRPKTLLVCPTGTGKTVIFSEIVRRIVAAGKRVLVLAHREELLNQAAEKIETLTGCMTALEKGTQTSLHSMAPITIASVQTLSRESRLQAFDHDHFDTVIIDEAHHALSPTYRRIIDYFQAKYLGVTATPDRGDKKKLGEIFDSLAFEYSTITAINQGYLVPIIAKQIPLKIDISQVGRSGGDYAAGDSGHAIEPYLSEIAREVKPLCPDRKIVMFLPLIDTSRKMVKALQDIGIAAAEVNGESADRAEIIRDFERGKYSVLCNAMLLTEGWDCPEVDCIVILRPTKIRSLYVQMVGRGTRPAEGKKDLLLLDFLWQSGRMELCRPADIVADKEEKLARITQKLTDADGEQLDLLELADEVDSDIVKEREQAMKDLLEKNSTKKSKTVNVMQFEFSIGGGMLLDYKPDFAWEREPVTEKQAQTLRKMGVDPDSISCKGAAVIIIGRLYKRIKAGLATPLQMRTLERYGMKDVGNWTKDEATRAIGFIAQNNWRMNAIVKEQIRGIRA